jgi:opacity protein-like surface antigen
MSNNKNLLRVRLIFILISTFLLADVNAQKHPSFIGIRGGASFPFGKYHEKNLDGGSFTLTGFNVSTEGAWFFNPKFGVGAAAGINFHPVDVGYLGWEKVQADPFLEDVYIRSEPYKIVTAMAGFYTQLPIKGKLSFTGKLLGGLFWGQTPYQLYKPKYFMVGPSYFEITPATDWKFSWQAGIGLRYDISPCFGLVLDGEILYDKLSFNYKTGSGTRTDERIISFINTTLGIRFNL